MKNLSYIFALLLLNTPVNAGIYETKSDEESLNAREASQLCQQEITLQYIETQGEIKFSRRPASSIRAGKFTFWINTTEYKDSDAETIRYVCEIEKSGEVTVLTREPGRWRI